MFENPTVKLKSLRISCAKIACCSSESIFTSVYAASSIQNASKAIRLVYPNLFCKLPSPSSPANKKKINEQIQTALSRSPISIRRIFIRIFFTHWPILSPSKTLTFPPESPCIVWNSRMMNNEVERTWKTAVVAWLEVPPWKFVWR